MARLGRGDVDAVGERRDHEAAGVAQILERVAEGRVADVDPHVLLLVAVALVVPRLELAEPLEAVLRLEAVGDQPQVDVARMGLERNQVHHLPPLQLVELALHQGDQVGQVLDLLGRVLLERVRLALPHPIEGVLGLLRPEELRAHDAELRDVVEEPLLPLALLVVVDRHRRLLEELVAHADDQVAEVHLHLPLERERAALGELHLLALVRDDRIDRRRAGARQFELLDALEHRVDVLRDDGGAVAVREDVEEHRGGDEVEAGEDPLLAVEELGEVLLALLQRGGHLLERLDQPVGVARGDGVLRLVDRLRRRLEGAVDRDERLRALGSFFTSSEPMKSVSRYAHLRCTSDIPASTSETQPSFFCQPTTSSSNCARYFDPIIPWTTIWFSSSVSKSSSFIFIRLTSESRWRSNSNSTTASTST